MFLKKYVNNLYYEEILENYKEEYLKILEEENFELIYKLFVDNEFYYVKDIILKYLEIFTMEYDEVVEKLEKLKKSLGINYVAIIGNDLRYLDYILK
ncbi:MAG: hypothetical protein MR296_04225 [Tenericutes bacterium]|nr:hypothetical protein [Mycoplasmatota bacterium]